MITLVGNVRLTARGGEVKEFFFLPSDLKRSNGDEVIGRQNVKLVGSPRLAMDTPKDFQVSVSGIEIPGEYQGQIQIMLPGQTITQAVSIKLKALDRAPTLVLCATDRLTGRWVKCLVY